MEGAKNAYQATQSQTAQTCVIIFSVFVPTFTDYSGPAVNICGPQLATMLGCWAATNDLHAKGQCIEAAQDLYNCMRTTVCCYPYIFMFNRVTNYQNTSLFQGNSTDLV